MRLIQRRRGLEMAGDKTNAPLMFSVSGTATVTATISLSSFGSRVLYTKQGNGDWEQWTSGSKTVTPTTPLYLKGDNPNGFSTGNKSANYCTIQTATSSQYYALLSISGNVMSLLGEDVKDIPCDYCFYRLFLNGNISYSSELVLPAQNITANCYREMFQQNALMNDTPAVLPALSLKSGCYRNMFYSCSRIATTPKLPAATLVDSCYNQMFGSCSAVDKVQSLAVNGINTNSSTSNWLQGVKSSGTFTKAASATWPSGNSGIPSGWTVVNQ